jgi:hypothetical protein
VGATGERERKKINMCHYYMKSDYLRGENILLTTPWDAFNFFMAGYTPVLDESVWFLPGSSFHFENCVCSVTTT